MEFVGYLYITDIIHTFYVMKTNSCELRLQEVSTRNYQTQSDYVATAAL